jgi:hypothetical protein
MSCRHLCPAPDRKDWDERLSLQTKSARVSEEKVGSLETAGQTPNGVRRSGALRINIQGASAVGQTPAWLLLDSG